MIQCMMLIILLKMIKNFEIILLLITFIIYDYVVILEKIAEEEKFYPLHTHRAPKSDPWGMTQATELKSRLICFVSFICENKHVKFGIKIFEIDI